MTHKMMPDMTRWCRGVEIIAHGAEEGRNWNPEARKWSLKAGKWKPETGKWIVDAGKWCPGISIRCGSPQYPEFRVPFCRIPGGTLGSNISAPGPKAPKACLDLCGYAFCMYSLCMSSFSFLSFFLCFYLCIVFIHLVDLYVLWHSPGPPGFPGILYFSLLFSHRFLERLPGEAQGARGVPEHIQINKMNKDNA